MEDHAVNRKVVATILSARGASVVPAENGKDALELLEKERFDLIFMDVQMPVMDGLEATARIRARERVTGEHVPIVAMTAYALKGDRERCLDAGMDNYISKPLEVERLLEVLSAFVSRARSGRSHTVL